MMNTKWFGIFFLINLLIMINTRFSESKDPSKWDAGQIDQWFEKGEWLNGWTVRPDPSINRKVLAISYFKNRMKWDKAFAFLRDIDFSSAELRKYDIEGEKAYAIASTYHSKNEEDAKYEAHKKYIDIQYVFKGKELIGLTTPEKKKADILPYDPQRDIEFMTVSEGRNLKANQDIFFIFFPEDIHCPGIKDGENTPVSKIVVKVLVE